MTHSRVTDLVLREGRCAAKRLAARNPVTDADRDEVLADAGKRVEHALTEWCYGPEVIAKAKQLVIDTFEGGGIET